MQVAVRVAEHDPHRRLARSARNGDRSRLPRRQYRVELPLALPRGHHHVEAVGLVDVGDQGGGVAGELRPMGGHWSLAGELDFAIMHRVPKATTSEYLRRLDRHGSGDGERCSRYKSLHVISRYSGQLPVAWRH